MYVCMSVCMYVFLYLSLYPSFYLSIFPFVNQLKKKSNMMRKESRRACVYVCMYVSVSLSIYLSIQLSIFLSVTQLEKESLYYEAEVGRGREGTGMEGSSGRGRHDLGVTILAPKHLQMALLTVTSHLHLLYIPLLPRSLPPSRRASANTLPALVH